MPVVLVIGAGKFLVLGGLWLGAGWAVGWGGMVLEPFGTHLGKLAVVLVVVPVAFNFMEGRLLARVGEEGGSQKNWLRLLQNDVRCESLEECEIFQGDEDSILSNC